MADSLFSFLNLAVLPAWFLLAFAPRWRWTQLVAAVITPALLSCVYAGLFLQQFAGSSGGFGSLAQVAQLFDNPWILLAGWVHYLAFDLLVGAWEVRDSLRLGIAPWLVVPCLLLTLVLGPIGFLSYAVMRFSRTRSIIPSNDPSH